MQLACRLGWHPEVELHSYWIQVPPSVLPDAQPLRIAFAADFHAGPTTQPERIRQACAKLSSLAPHLLLLGGDYITVDSRYIDDLAEMLGQVPAPLGRYAVLGNHDIWTGKQHILERLQSAGVHLLMNASKVLSPPYDTIEIVGLDDPRSGQPAWPSIQGRGAELRLVLMHSPDGLLSLDGLPFTVAFCGHTHGGQVALPGGVPILLSRGRLCRPYSRGRFSVGQKNQSALIVTTGVGYSALPVRINSPSEVVLCTLSPDRL
jgi:predicted MPP superfamily phosphohydrolase